LSKGAGEQRAPQAQRIKIKEYCRMQAERERGFSKLAMYLSYLPVHLIDLEGTFCSKHVASALVEGQVDGLAGLNPSLVTPSSLFKMLMKTSMQSPIVQVIPGRMSQDTGQSSACALKEILIKNYH
jgi:hypothetical protein